MSITNSDDSGDDSSADDLQLDRCPGIASDGTQCGLDPSWGSDHPLLCRYHNDQRLAVTWTGLVTASTDATEPALVVQAGDRIHVHLDDGPRYRLRVSEVADTGDVTVGGADGDGTDSGDDDEVTVGGAGGYGGGGYGDDGYGE